MFLIHSRVDHAPLQPRFLGVLFDQLLDHPVDFYELAATTPEAVAQAAGSTLPGAILGFIGAVNIFQTGLLPSLVVGPCYTHSLEVPGGTERIADAIHFGVATEPLASLREGWGITPKAPLAQS